LQVPVAIGGKGLPDEAKFRQDLPDAGLTNVTGAIMNLLGFQACHLLVRSLNHCFPSSHDAAGRLQQ
jgi:hypothetical protein